MTDTSRSLLEKFMKLNRIMMKYQVMNYKEHGPFGNPERGQGRVLSILMLKPEISQKDLAFLLDMRNQSLGELLTKLEKKGLIVREHSEKDKRAMMVKLTEEGKKAADKIEDKQAEADQIFDCLNEDEQKNLDDYLTRIIEEMKKHDVNFDEMNFTDEEREKFRKGFGRFHRHMHGKEGPFGHEGHFMHGKMKGKMKDDKESNE